MIGRTGRRYRTVQFRVGQPWLTAEYPLPGQAGSGGREEEQRADYEQNRRPPRVSSVLAEAAPLPDEIGSASRGGVVEAPCVRSAGGRRLVLEPRQQVCDVVKQQVTHFAAGADAHHDAHGGEVLPLAGKM